MTAEHYPSGAAHLLDELGYLDLLLRRAVVIARARRPASDPEAFRGMVISEAELDRLINDVVLEGDTPASATLADLDEAVADDRARIRARIEASRGAGVRLPLIEFASSRGLSEAETDLVLVALAPEIETRYETIYAYLQNDVTRKRPSVELALELICRDADEKLFARHLLARDSRLVAGQILALGEEGYDRQPTELRRFLKLNEFVLRFLLDQPPAGGDGTRIVLPTQARAELSAAAATARALDALVRGLRQTGTEKTIVLLQGSADAPLDAAATALGQALERTLLMVDFEPLTVAPERARAIALDASLWNALPVLRLPSTPEDEASRRKIETALGAFWDALREAEGGVVVLGRAEDIRLLPADFRTWRVDVLPPDLAERRDLWAVATRSGIADADAARLADQFPFGAERVRQAVSLAHTAAALRNPARPHPQMRDLLDAARALATPNLRRFAVVVSPRHGWDDLVLPAERRQQLRSIEARVLNRALVQDDWGFGDKLTRGRGVAVLFSGPPGTGKTMAAEIIARGLALDLFQIDLSTVMSKYVGETERQLATIFAEAEKGRCILFFDECDSVFGKRTELRDAHDHYANTQVNFLLQRLEQYEGIVLLATNFQKNIDEAFLRRLHDSVDFPFPDETARAEIWRRQFPDRAPLAKGIDVAWLATQFRLAGGGIHNAAQYAAYRAAEEDGQQARITMDHVMEGVRREFQKLGKLVVAADQAPAAPENPRVNLFRRMLALLPSWRRAVAPLPPPEPARLPALLEPPETHKAASPPPRRRPPPDPAERTRYFGTVYVRPYSRAGPPHGPPLQTRAPLPLQSPATGRATADAPGLIQSIEPIRFSAFAIWPEDAAEMPAEATRRWRGDPLLRTSAAALRDNVLAHAAAGGLALRPQALFDPAMRDTGQAAAALLLCHMVTKLFARGGDIVGRAVDHRTGTFSDGRLPAGIGDTGDWVPLLRFGDAVARHRLGRLRAAGAGFERRGNTTSRADRSRRERAAGRGHRRFERLPRLALGERPVLRRIRYLGRTGCPRPLRGAHRAPSDAVRPAPRGRAGLCGVALDGAGSGRSAIRQYDGSPSARRFLRRAGGMMRLGPASLGILCAAASQPEREALAIICAVEGGLACRATDGDWDDPSLVDLPRALAQDLDYKTIEHAPHRQVTIRFDQAQERCEIDLGEGCLPERGDG